MHQLIDKKDKEQIRYEMFDMHFLFDEYNNDNFIKHSSIQIEDKITNKIEYTVEDTTFEIASILSRPTPPLVYD
jgi:hypothetical protein